MKDEWTGDAVKLMHINGISALDLAEKIGWNPKYLSAVLNCKRKPKGAEGVVMSAVSELVYENKGDG